MDYIEELMVASIAGNIAKKDQAFLEEMIAADTQVAELWQQHLLIASQLKHTYNKEAAWKNIEAGIDQKQKRRIPVPVFALLALVVIITGTLMYFNRSTKNVQTAMVPAKNLTAGNTITFATANEKVSVDKNTVSTNAADIINENGTLVFIPKNNENAISTLEVPQGLDRRIKLNDSTLVWVNAATKISFPLLFTGATREVTLDGEAYFEVAKNKAKPFIVHTREMDVKVKGTHFNIKAYNGEAVQASLTEGSVQAKNTASQIVLIPGRAAAIENGKLVEKNFDESIVLAWMKGAYYFDNEELASISHTVDRWFGYSFSYSDPSIQTIRFSGALEKAQTLEAFLMRLCSSANLDYSVTDKQVSLSKKK